MGPLPGLKESFFAQQKVLLSKVCVVSDGWISSEKKVTEEKCLIANRASRRGLVVNPIAWGQFLPISEGVI